MKLTKQELLDSYETCTYLDGLKDALDMTKEEIQKAIDIIVKG